MYDNPERADSYPCSSYDIGGSWVCRWMLRPYFLEPDSRNQDNPIMKFTVRHQSSIIRVLNLFLNPNFPRLNRKWCQGSETTWELGLNISMILLRVATIKSRVGIQSQRRCIGIKILLAQSSRAVGRWLNEKLCGDQWYMIYHNQMSCRLEDNSFSSTYEGCFHVSEMDLKGLGTWDMFQNNSVAQRMMGLMARNGILIPDSLLLHQFIRMIGVGTWVLLVSSQLIEALRVGGSVLIHFPRFKDTATYIPYVPYGPPPILSNPRVEIEPKMYKVVN